MSQPHARFWPSTSPPPSTRTRSPPSTEKLSRPQKRRRRLQLLAAGHASAAATVSTSAPSTSSFCSATAVQDALTARLSCIEAKLERLDGRGSTGANAASLARIESKLDDFLFSVTATSSWQAPGAWDEPLWPPSGAPLRADALEFFPFEYTDELHTALPSTAAGVKDTKMDMEEKMDEVDGKVMEMEAASQKEVVVRDGGIARVSERSPLPLSSFTHAEAPLPTPIERSVIAPLELSEEVVAVALGESVYAGNAPGAPAAVGSVSARGNPAPSPASSAAALEHDEVPTVETLEFPKKVEVVTVAQQHAETQSSEVHAQKAQKKDDDRHSLEEQVISAHVMNALLPNRLSCSGVQLRDYSPVFECILVDSLRVKLKRKIEGLIHEMTNAGVVDLGRLEDQIFYELGDIMELSDSGYLAVQEQISKHLGAILADQT